MSALMYAIFAVIFLKQRFSVLEWIGVFIASFGVMTVLFFDITAIEHAKAGLGFLFGLGSSIALAILMILTSVIVQHNHPIMVTFHQCISGVVISLLLLVFFINKINIADFESVHLRSAIYSGSLYALALIFFFKAFIHIEPIFIATSSFSLFVFVSLFESLLNNEWSPIQDFLSGLLITAGCAILVFSEHIKSKSSSPLLKAIRASKPLYMKDPSNRIRDLKDKFKNGLLNKYEFISEVYEYNRIIFELSEELIGSPIKAINISAENPSFVFSSPPITIEVDKSCRSAPFEILNFGNYENEEDEFINRILRGDEIILDIGANIGWFSVIFAKRYSDLKIYAFEPIKKTYNIFLKNISNNNLVNIVAENIALSNRPGEVDFFFSELGSPIASIKNIFDLETPEKIKCLSTTVDIFCHTNKISHIDLIKCDVEGSEYLVLQGAKQVLLKDQPIVMIEIIENWCEKFSYSSLDLLNYMNDLGYSCFQLANGVLHRIFSIDENNLINFNYIFLNREKHDKFFK